MLFDKLSIFSECIWYTSNSTMFLFGDSCFYIFDITGFKLSPIQQET